MSWIRTVLLVVALSCGVCALALLMLPVMLVLLMILFDSSAHAVLVLLGLVASWIGALAPGGGGSALPFYDAVSVDPWRVALAAAAQALPCLAGLLLAVAGRNRSWWAVAGLWGIAALLGGRDAAVLLAPGIAAAVLLQCVGSVPQRRVAAERERDRG